MRYSRRSQILSTFRFHPAASVEEDKSISGHVQVTCQWVGPNGTRSIQCVYLEPDQNCTVVPWVDVEILVALRRFAEFPASYLRRIDPQRIVADHLGPAYPVFIAVDQRAEIRLVLSLSVIEFFYRIKLRTKLLKR